MEAKLKGGEGAYNQMSFSFSLHGPVTGRTYMVVGALNYEMPLCTQPYFTCRIKLLSTVVYFVFITSPQSASAGRANHGTHITKHESYLE